MGIYYELITPSGFIYANILERNYNHPPTINMIRPSGLGLLCHSLKAPSTTAVYLGSDNFRAFQCSREQNDGPCLVRGTGISMIGGGWGHSCTKSVFRACTVS